MDFSISNPISSIVETIGKIIDKVVPDTAAKEAAKAALLAQQSTQDFQLLLGQLQINIEEAKSTNWFIAGWRPAVSWVCACGLALQYLIFPIVALAGYKVPPVDFSTLMGILIPILGLGAYRTVEKVKDAEGNR
jgi:hypothetical protein